MGSDLKLLTLSAPHPNIFTSLIAIISLDGRSLLYLLSYAVIFLFYNCGRAYLCIQWLYLQPDCRGTCISCIYELINLLRWLPCQRQLIVLMGVSWHYLYIFVPFCYLSMSNKQFWIWNHVVLLLLNVHHHITSRAHARCMLCHLCSF